MLVSDEAGPRKKRRRRGSRKKKADAPGDVTHDTAPRDEDS